MFHLHIFGLIYKKNLFFNRNMKIGIRRYFYMFSIVLIINVIYAVADIFFVIPYSGGGVQQFVEINKIFPFFQTEMVNLGILTSLLLAFIELVPYFIIIFCGIKMVKYVNEHTGLDQEMKRLFKQLTKTLILLVCFELGN
ncbi:unnamed protein product [Meloidogyne enterolobii]|uniref:Uncharacterized protein n=1 Tax=Meloidogyne enterolobii TaxID=390850 RepID=A0ACB1AIE6_MELEN